MTIYILGSILLGLLQTVSNIFVRNGAKENVDPFEYGFWVNLFTTVYILIFTAAKNLPPSNIRALWQITDVAEIVVMMGLGAVFSAQSNNAVLSAMKIGHPGITNAVSTSAFAMNFILLVLFFNNKATALNYVAVALVLAGVLLMTNISGKIGVSKRWVGLCAFIFVCATFSMFTTTIPSQHGCSDPLNLRAVVVIFGMTIFNGIMKLTLKLKTDKTCVKTGAVSAIFITAVQILTYPITDKLAGFDCAYVVSTLLYASNLVSFNAYCVVFGKQKLSKMQFAGLAACLAGILLFLVR